VKNKTQKT